MAPTNRWSEVLVLRTSLNYAARCCTPVAVDNYSAGEGLVDGRSGCSVSQQGESGTRAELHGFSMPPRTSASRARDLIFFSALTLSFSLSWGEEAQVSLSQDFA